MSVKCWQDLGFDHFSLPLTSLVLRTLRPLVWQPAITPMMPGGIGTPVFPVNMVGSRAQQRVPVAFESSKTEVMARAISWRLWAVFHERVRVTTPTIDWFDEFFDAIAIAARLECNGTGPLVINGSPLAHLSFKTLYHDRVPPEEQRHNPRAPLNASSTAPLSRQRGPGDSNSSAEENRGSAACVRIDDLDAIASIVKPLRPRERAHLAAGLADICDAHSLARVTDGIFDSKTTLRIAFHNLSHDYERQLRWWY